jgi:pyruvate-ferredoxin/flavodoxin oxidoreductase
MAHQRDAVRSGLWPLFRYRPTTEDHQHPFSLDSHEPSISVREFAHSESRFSMLERSDPDRSDALLELAQADVDERWHLYEQLAGVEREIPAPGPR